METKKVHIEMECIHDQAAGTMTCSWLGGEIRIVVDFGVRMLGIFRSDRIIETRDISEMSIEEFMRIEEQCQQSADSLSTIDLMAV